MPHFCSILSPIDLHWSRSICVSNQKCKSLPTTSKIKNKVRFNGRLMRSWE